MAFIKNVEVYCYENRMNDAEFERKCGFSKGMVYKWRVRQNQHPSVSSLLKIEKATTIPMAAWLREGGVADALAAH